MTVSAPTLATEEITSTNANESNQTWAANFLQLANGNFVIWKNTFSLPSKVADCMSIQSFQQHNGYKGTLWIDSSTNVIAMGHSFKMIEEI
eukprot:8743591-Ditylum_brightwellii.AAC.1